MLTISLVQPRLTTSFIGREITYYPSTGSTNTDLWALVDSGEAMPGQVVITDDQQSGRGRQGRRWFSAAGLGLTFSIFLSPKLPQERLGLLSLGMGVAVADALELENVKARLKWPNDIVWEGHKLGGILAESRMTDEGPAVVIGTGINVNEQITDFPEELHSAAVSVYMVLGRPIQRELLLASTLNRFEELLKDCLDDVTSFWQERCDHLGYPVRFDGPDGRLEGRFTGVNPAGQGLIEIGSEIHELSAGDLDLKPE
ncbi:MAG: biotin--[acetyl-CoA-carboxylase] ligase [Fidelibacterota bacterium]|nr:MAG: biotin--[acetyl-CoA-carboxylase] ligase [Candidatus Neomarinimicrobiota bacterium]